VGGPPEENVGLAALDGVGPGSRVGGYLIEERLGRGGMAVVFRARDQRLGRMVALKVLAPALSEDAEFRERFIRESRAAAAVDDAHIIPVFEAGENGGVLFIAMRYVAGGDVRSLLRRSGPLPAWRAAAIVSPVASALDAAHAAGLVHRDVKPANMLVETRPGRPDHVYLSDFGVSKGAATSVGLTGSGLLLGTPDYISPEQIAGQAVDGRADQYSLACTAFELLTGTLPFPRDHGMAVIYAHVSEPPPLLSSRLPQSPPAADAVLAKGMAKNVADRYRSCHEFAESLRSALGVAPYETHLATGGSGTASGERIVTVVVPEPPPGPAMSQGDTQTFSPRRQASRLEEPGSGPDDQTATVPAHFHHSRLYRQTAAVAGGLVIVAAVAVSLLATRSAPPATHPRAPAGSPSPRAPTRSPSPRAPTSSPPPSVRYVFSSHTAPVATGGNLAGIAVVPGTTAAWAVGWNLAQASMIYHWDGTTWSPSPSPGLGPGSLLYAVAATSATDVWAVGSVGDSGLIEHWNGTAWTAVPAPQPPPANTLTGVAAPSPTSAWAVGYTYSGTNGNPDWQCLIEHWDGTAWTQVPIPNTGGTLTAVTATSPTNAWAVGSTDTGTGVGNLLILHWNGAAWTRAPVPAIQGDLNAVTATSPTNAWAVGTAVILHWDGTTWNDVVAPTVTDGLTNQYTGVTAASPTSAWAVDFGSVFHWNGTAWQQVGVVNGQLSGIAATSPAGAWVVGGTGAPFLETTRTVIMRWKATAQG
jgi:serine/threonine protein kinase